MINVALAEAHEIHNLMDLIPGIHEWWQAVSYTHLTLPTILLV